MIVAPLTGSQEKLLRHLAASTGSELVDGAREPAAARLVGEGFAIQRTSVRWEATPEGRAHLLWLDTPAEEPTLGAKFKRRATGQIYEATTWEGLGVLGMTCGKSTRRVTVEQLVDRRGSWLPA